MGTLQKKARKASKKARSPMGKSTVTVNRAGGVAFDIEDPSEKLLTMVGAKLDISEPSYYSADKCIARRGAHERFEKLQERVKIVDGKLEAFMGGVELNDLAREIVATAVDVMNSDNPRDVLAIANWLRNEMHLRLTPAILLVLASMHPNGKPFVRGYGDKIVKRPDDIKNALLFWRFIQGTKLAPKSLRSGLADALSKFNEVNLMKYDGKDFPTWKDILRWLPRKKDWPVKQAVRNYFVDGVVDEEALPRIAERKRLYSMETLNEEAKTLIKKTRATWENVLSQFGRDKEGKKKCWEYLIRTNMLGYMAMLRNLRNMIEADVGKTALDRVAKKLGDPDEVKKSRQLPFRFVAAGEAIDQYRGYHKLIGPVYDAIEDAVDVACENVPELPGVTAVFADNSGSMNVTVSQKSQITCRDAANILAGVIAKRGEEAHICGFSSSVKPFRVTKRTTALGLARKMGKDQIPRGTEMHLIFEWLKKNEIVADRVIVLSDMQAWFSRPVRYHQRTYNEDQNVAVLWEDYKRFCGKRKPWLHCVHMNGYGDNPAPADDPHVNLVSGFSENIVRMLLRTEAGAEPKEVSEDTPVAAKELPTLEQIRKEW